MLYEYNLEIIFEFNPDLNQHVNIFCSRVFVLKNTKKNDTNDV